MTQPTTELDGLLIESLTRLTAHLDEQNERIENLTKQLHAHSEQTEQLLTEQDQLRLLVEHLRTQVDALTKRLPA